MKPFWKLASIIPLDGLIRWTDMGWSGSIDCLGDEMQPMRFQPESSATLKATVLGSKARYFTSRCDEKSHVYIYFLWDGDSTCLMSPNTSQSALVP